MSFWYWLQVIKRIMHPNHWAVLNFSSWARIWQCLYVCLYVCPKLWGTLETSKMVRFAWNFAHFFLPGGVFFIFWKFWFLGAWSRVLVPKRGLKCWGSLETSKMVRFGWNFAHFFLRWIPGVFFFIFWKFWYLGAWSRVLVPKRG